MTLFVWHIALLCLSGNSSTMSVCLGKLVKGKYCASQRKKTRKQMKIFAYQKVRK